VPETRQAAACWAGKIQNKSVKLEKKELNLITNKGEYEYV